MIESTYSNDDIILDTQSGSPKDSPESNRSSVKNGKQDVDFDLPLELSPAAKTEDAKLSADRLRECDCGGGGNSRREGCCLKQGAGETVSSRSSRSSSHPRSHVSLSSYDSNDLLCETPTMPLSPEEKRDDSSSTDNLFNNSLKRYADNDSDDECAHQIGEDEREDEIERDSPLRTKSESEVTIENIVVDSPSSKSSSVVSAMALTSPPSKDKQEEGSPVDSEPAFSFPDYPPLGEYSFGEFEEDTGYPSDPLPELPSLELVTPVNERTSSILATSSNTSIMDTVKRKVQDFRTPANYCEGDLQTDNDITPTPDFKSMRTPHLKGQCARYGVKAMAKKKMIAKLHEIYEHTHPLVGKLRAIFILRVKSLSYNVLL